MAEEKKTNKNYQKNSFPQTFAQESTPAILEYDDEVLLDRARVIDKIAEYCDREFCTLRDILNSNGREANEQFCSQCERGYVWCPTKQAVLYSDIGMDTLLQKRAMDDLKYIESEHLGRDIGDEAAKRDWMEYCAADFRRQYNRGVRNPDIILRKCVIPGATKALEERLKIKFELLESLK